MQRNAGMTHSVQSSGLADVLERVLDKGLVIAGDIKVKLVDIELLTLQIRLVICSVEKAQEMGMDWWRHDANLSSAAQQPALPNPEVLELQEQVQALESRLEAMSNNKAKSRTRRASASKAGSSSKGNSKTASSKTAES